MLKLRYLGLLTMTLCFQGCVMFDGGSSSSSSANYDNSGFEDNYSQQYGEQTSSNGGASYEAPVKVSTQEKQIKAAKPELKPSIQEQKNNPSANNKVLLPITGNIE